MISLEQGVALFLAVYRPTRSAEAAMLELKRLGATQEATARILVDIFGIDSTSATQAVASSLAWQE